MDPVTGIGLAAAILQFVGFAAKVVDRLADFGAAIENGPKVFRQIRTELPLILVSLRRIQHRSNAGSLDTTTEIALCQVIQDCQRSAKQLNDLLDKTIPTVDASSWERRKKALISLTKDKTIEEIADSLHKYVEVLTLYQVVDDRTSLGVSSAKDPPVFWLVPFDRNSAFVGRKSIIKQIDTAFIVKEGSQPKAALFGLGGIGKTQIAIEYCYLRHQQDARCSVFWVHAATAARFEQSFIRIAQECGLLAEGVSHAEAVLLVKNWLETRQQGLWLMVIDNVDDRDTFFHGKLLNGMTPLESIPRAPQGSILFTTRSRDMAVDLAPPSTPIVTPMMSKEEGLQWVRGRLGGEQDDKLTEEFLYELEYIPLAVAQALAFIIKRRKTIQQYLEQYRTNDSTRTRMLTHEFSEHGREGSSMDSVAKTWAISFAWIRDDNPRAADMLCLAALLQHQGIPKQLLLNESEDDFDFEEAVATLRAFSFLDADETGTTFKTHRLVQLATRWWLQGGGQPQIDRWAFEAMRSVATHFPEPTSSPREDYWKTCERLLPHANLLLQYIFRGAQRDAELEKARLLTHTGRYIYWVGDAEGGQARFAKSLEIREKYLEEENVDRLQSMGLLAWALCFSPRPTELIEAVELGRRVVELRGKVLGPDHPDTIDALSDLAGALSATGEHSQSEKLQRDAVARSTRVLGRRNPDTLNCLSRLADVLGCQWKYKEAIETESEAYYSGLETLGPDHPSVLIAEHNLSYYLEEDGRIEEARKHYSHALETKERVRGVDHFDTLVTAMNLVRLLAKQAQFADAINVCNSTLKKCESGPRRGNLRTEGLLRQLKCKGEDITRYLEKLFGEDGEREVYSSESDVEIAPILAIVSEGVPAKSIPTLPP